MSYQSVSKCRFFIDHALWFKATNSWGSFEISDQVKELGTLNPANQYSYEDLYVKIPNYPPANYIAFLGHDMERVYPRFEHTDGTTTEPEEVEPVINAGGYGGLAEYAGYSIQTFTEDDGHPIITGVCTSGTRIGAVSIGSTYTMSHSPDMEINLEYNYSGVKNIRTKGGSDLSNSFYSGPPNWGALGAWELGYVNPFTGIIPNQNLARSGRKIYSLSFSFIKDEDTFGSNQKLSNYMEPGTTGVNASDLDTTDFQYNLLTEESFFTSVVNRVQGSRLPFIFQPDKDDNNNFIIGKFQNKSFKFTQVSHTVWNFSCKIVESW